MSPTHTSLITLDTCHSSLSTFGELTLPLTDGDLTFQIDIVPSESPEVIWFGLLNPPANQSNRLAGFAVRIDLVRGEVWDAQNGLGLLGTLETGPLGLDRFDQDDTLLLSLRLEKRGPNLIPSLQIGGTPCLYPALTLSNLHNDCLTAVAGAAETGRDAPPFTHYPAFWLSPCSR
jgi:hypothetical protein